MKKLVLSAIFGSLCLGNNFSTIMDLIDVYNDKKDAHRFHFDIEGNQKALEDTGVQNAQDNAENSDAPKKFNPAEMFNKASKDLNKIINNAKDGASSAPDN